ncbi:MAG TPA: hypothetical protein VM243_13710 [Phycisphaerae bacterium]|nr:hypothetical protein [Phycisphaerae bacterium]HUU84550.1 hypothetical protein [Phycisphaerae bacterium]
MRRVLEEEIDQRQATTDSGDYGQGEGEIAGEVIDMMLLIAMPEEPGDDPIGGGAGRVAVPIHREGLQ